MENPKVSLIIPIYNKAPFLKRCLDSVAKQMRDDVEVIAIDDCSTDGSDKILLGYDKFNRVFHTQNAGVSATRNEGIDMAKGQAIAFLDADDELRPDALETIAAYAERVEKWPIIQYGHCRIHKDGQISVQSAEKGSYSIPELPKHWQMVWNKVYSKKFIVERFARFNEKMHFGEDEIFNVDCIIPAVKIWHAPAILVNHWLDDKHSLCRGGSVDTKATQKFDKSLYDRLKASQSPKVKRWLNDRLDYLHHSAMFRKAKFSTKGMSKYDVVYLLKESPYNEELRYSLRSLDLNFAYKKVWFVGGQPKGLVPDERMPIVQDAPSKWENVRNMLVDVCKNDNISKDFWLFNDDFFVMHKTDSSVGQCYNGTLLEQIERVEEREGCRSDYTSRLRHLMETLQNANLPTLNYSVHKPILVNRAKALEVLEKFPNEPMFRALYGNYWKIGGTNGRDCKIRRCDREINKKSRFLSTQDDSFEYGIVGMQLRAMFGHKSRFEV